MPEILQKRRTIVMVYPYHIGEDASRYGSAAGSVWSGDADRLRRLFSRKRRGYYSSSDASQRRTREQLQAPCPRAGA